jgi:hypothetical protein
MGIIYSVVLEGTFSFWLEEVRTLSTWEEMKHELRKGDVLKDNRHYELLLNPYQIDGGHTSIITTRNVVSPPANLPLTKNNRSSPWFSGEYIYQ